MKRTLVLLALCLPLAVFAAEEPANVTEVREDFMAAIAARGLDPKRCAVTLLQSSEEGHLVEAACEELPLMYLVVVHPTQALAQPLKCIENPDHKPAEPAQKL